jgi:hypothetical protein
VALYNTSPESIPKVGIFYFIDNSVLIDAVPAERGEPYADAIQHGSHYDFWQNLTPKTGIEKRLKSRAYDAYPRGRVVYFPKRTIYRIYYDTCIDFSDDMPFIKDRFGLDKVEIEYEHDVHYQCSKCNPYFLD